MSYRHYRAPRGDGEVLCDPSWTDLPAIFQRNRASVEERFKNERGLARLFLLDSARQYSQAYRDHLPALPTKEGDEPPPIVMAGHQPQMFHPGVWFKNFALDRLARVTGAVAVNLVIDNDAFRSAALRVPSGSADDPHVESIPFDQPSDELPYEERPILDRSLAASFAERVKQAIGPLMPDPLIGEYWPLVMEMARSTDRWGTCLAQARHRLEERWGLSTLEVPLSQVCDAPHFRLFAFDLLSSMPVFIQSYNGALADYRAAHRLRSKAHPVPDLEIDGEWMETPFWMWTRESPRRRRLFARRVAGQIELTDRANWRETIPAAAPDRITLQRIDEWSRGGWKLRPRALTTTLYARMFLCDLFLHGIGGGKYDQVTERIARSFYGHELPAGGVVTGTWRLPIARPLFQGEEFRSLEEKLRRLDFDPGYFLASAPREGRSPQLQEMLDERGRWTASRDESIDRGERHRSLARVRHALAPFAAPLREEWLARRAALERQARIEGLLGSRETPFVLFPEKNLHDRLLAFFVDKP